MDGRVEMVRRAVPEVRFAVGPERRDQRSHGDPAVLARCSRLCRRRRERGDEVDASRIAQAVVRAVLVATLLPWALLLGHGIKVWDLPPVYGVMVVLPPMLSLGGWLSLRWHHRLMLAFLALQQEREALRPEVAAETDLIARQRALLRRAAGLRRAWAVIALLLALPLLVKPLLFLIVGWVPLGLAAWIWPWRPYRRLTIA